MPSSFWPFTVTNYRQIGPSPLNKYPPTLFDMWPIDCKARMSRHPRALTWDFKVLVTYPCTMIIPGRDFAEGVEGGYITTSCKLAPSILAPRKLACWRSLPDRSQFCRQGVIIRQTVDVGSTETRYKFPCSVMHWCRGQCTFPYIWCYTLVH